MNNKLFLGVLVLACRLSAQAGLYTYSDSGTLQPNSANSLNFSHVISTEPVSISSIVLTLDFSSSSGLNNNGLQGFLYLGTGASPYAESLTPNSPIFHAAAGGNPAYFSSTLTFGSTSAFYGHNPDSTWTLNLWDSNATFGNNFTGWSLDVTAVPEPINIALPIFGVLTLAGGLISRRLKAVLNQAAK